MFTYRTFDLSIERNVKVKALRWPSAEDASADSGLGGNRLYADLRGCSWADAGRVFSLETDLIARIEDAEDPDEELSVIDDELNEDDEGLGGLDIGVASTVISLYAARCLPFASCNAGAFGGHHTEAYPLVAFFSRPQMIRLLLETATESGIGLENLDAGALVAYANDIRCLRAFAAHLAARKELFDAIPLRRKSHRRTRNSKPDQLGLSLDCPARAENHE